MNLKPCGLGFIQYFSQSVELSMPKRNDKGSSCQWTSRLSLIVYTSIDNASFFCCQWCRCFSPDKDLYSYCVSMYHVGEHIFWFSLFYNTDIFLICLVFYSFVLTRLFNKISHEKNILLEITTRSDIGRQMGQITAISVSHWSVTTINYYVNAHIYDSFVAITRICGVDLRNCGSQCDRSYGVFTP